MEFENETILLDDLFGGWKWLLKFRLGYGEVVMASERAHWNSSDVVVAPSGGFSLTVSVTVKRSCGRGMHRAEF